MDSSSYIRSSTIRRIASSFLQFTNDHPCHLVMVGIRLSSDMFSA